MPAVTQQIVCIDSLIECSCGHFECKCAFAFESFSSSFVCVACVMQLLSEGIDGSVLAFVHLDGKVYLEGRMTVGVVERNDVDTTEHFALFVAPKRSAAPFDLSAPLGFNGIINDQQLVLSLFMKGCDFFDQGSSTDQQQFSPIVAC